MRATYLEAQLAMLGPNGFLSPGSVVVGFYVLQSDNTSCVAHHTK